MTQIIAVASLNATKDALANVTLLSYPKLDAPTCHMIDASHAAVGAVLQQHIDGTWYIANLVLLHEATSH